MNSYFLFAKQIKEEHADLVSRIISFLGESGNVLLYQSIADHFFSKHQNIHSFSSLENATSGSVVITLGGDGTLLDAATLACKFDIPILGINLGRMGFLATVAIPEIEKTLLKLVKNQFSRESRAMLEIDTEHSVFGTNNFGLNELTIHKTDTSSMIKIHTFLDDVFLNSYWADGLIIATPTGSTAYSLSCGGPIVLPGSNNFIITPVAPHNLNVRPFVIPDSMTIRLEVEGRANRFMASLDSRTVIIDSAIKIILKKHQKRLQLIRIENEGYPSIIRKKLNWGLDIRN